MKACISNQKIYRKRKENLYKNNKVHFGHFSSTILSAQPKKGIV